MKQIPLLSPIQQTLQGLSDIAVMVRLLRGRIFQIAKSTSAAIIDERLEQIERRLKETHEYLFQTSSESR